MTNDEENANKISIIHSYHNLPLLSAWIDLEGLATLENDPNIAMIIAEKLVHASLTESGPLIKSPEAHNYGYTGKGVTVAVIDAGIDTDNPYLEDDLIWEECFLADGGCLFSEETRASGPGSAESGGNSHATHVSSTITSGNTSYPGIAPDANIVALKVLNVSGYGYYSDVLAALDWSISNKHTYNIRNCSGHFFLA